MHRLRMIAVTATLILLAATTPSFAGLNRWTTSGPEGAAITSLVSDPGDARILYAGTTNGGLFLSTSGGEQWEAIGAGILEMNVTALAIDPVSVYAGTSSGRLFVSRDRGGQWTEVKKPESGSVADLAIDSQRRSIYVATRTGLLIGQDEGKSWRVAQPSSARSVAVSPDGTVYASVSRSGLLVSSDGGVNWTPTTSVTFSSALAFDQSSNVYATQGVGVWSSSDRGKTWRLLPLLDSNASELVAVENRLYAATTVGLYVYEGGGLAWKRLGNLSQSVSAIAVASSSPHRIHAGTEGGIFVLTDDSAEWKSSNSGMLASVVSDVAITGNDVVHAATPAGLFQSKDAGASWQHSSAVSDPLKNVATNGREVIYASGRKGIKRSTDSGQTWKLVTTGSVGGLAVTGESPETLYATFNNALSKSRNGGETWSSVGHSLFLDDSGWFYYGLSPVVVETDVESPNTLYVVHEKGLARTDDGGHTWKTIYDRIIPALAARGTVIHAALTAGISTSMDRGQSWSAPRLTGEKVQAIVIDPADPRRSYAGTSSGRVYRSDDSGNDWALFSNGLRGAPVHRLEISRTSGRIYAATAAGVFEYQHVPGGTALGLERLPDDPLRLPRLVRQISSIISESASSLVLPAVGTVRGSGGAEFRTDVTLANDRAVEQPLIVVWLPQGNEAGATVPAFRVTLPASSDDAGGTMTITDFADELGLEGLGSVIVIAIGPTGDVDGSADIDGFARIRAASTCGSGSVSQSLPAVSAQASVRRGRALGLRHDSGHRTNVGIVNLAEVTREFTVVVDGQRHIERFMISVPPFSSRQSAVPEHDYGAVAITVTSSGSDPWTAYASSVDNASGDAWASSATPRSER